MNVNRISIIIVSTTYAYAMEQAVSKPLGTPSMELHQIARGLALAVEAVVENERDLTVNR